MGNSSILVCFLALNTESKDPQIFFHLHAVIGLYYDKLILFNIMHIIVKVIIDSELSSNLHIIASEKIKT